ncbi:MAG: flagellar basal body rod protein FlgC [bacterium]|nr:flagellar basal body rod protein FlgC [bacterium]
MINIKKLVLLLLVFTLSTIITSQIYSQGLVDSFDITTSGIIVQKMRLNVIAENVANITTLRDEETGVPYQKRFVVLRPSEKGVQIESIEKSTEPFGKYFDPSYPGTDSDGYYYYPNISLPDEMVNLNYTEMVYEANVSVFKSSKAMYQQALDIIK